MPVMWSLNVYWRTWRNDRGGTPSGTGARQRGLHGEESPRSGQEIAAAVPNAKQFVAIDSAALGAAVLTEVREGRREQMDQKAVAHRHAVLDWLTPKDYVSQQIDHLGRGRPGTRQWLIDSKEYSTWCGEGGRILFCLGIPGAGKTITTSIVVDDLTRKANQVTCVAYVYCDFRQQDEQTAQYLPSSLLRQLTRGQTSLLGCVDALHQRHSQPGTRPSVAELRATHVYS